MAKSKHKPKKTKEERKALNIKVLEHKITKCSSKINTFKKHNISDKKVAKLEARQARYEAQLIDENAS